MADAQAGQSQQQQQQRHAPGGSGSGGSGSRSGNHEQSADSAELTQSSPPKATRPAQLRRKSTDKVHSATTARPKGQKHVVGGGASTARLHARVPSSKALHKLHAPSAKLQEQTLLQLQQLQQLQQQQQQQQRQRRRFSPSPPTTPADFADRFPFAAAPPPDEPSLAQSQRKHQHRHSASSTDTKLLLRSLENSVSTSSLMRRNASASSLKRNRSHADVSKRMSHPPARPTSNLKRSTTSQGSGSDKLRQVSSTVAKKPAGQVRFEIGSVDAQEDEWVDAGPATASGSQTSSYRHEESKAAETGAGAQEAKTRPQPPTAQTQPQLTQIELPIRTAYPTQAQSRNNIASPPPPPLMPSMDDTEDEAAGEARQPSSSPPATPSILRSASSTKLLPRTPPRGAPPKMSHETAIATANASHVITSSPDSSPTRQMLHKQSVTGESSDRDAMTSRFITSGSHGSGSAGATTGESYYTASSSRSNIGRRESGTPSSRLSTSIGATALSPYQRIQGEGGADTSFLTDDEETGVFIARMHPRRTGKGAPPAERSRTQQKLNLERASSSIDRSSHQHQGPAAGPLLGGGENGMQDPRIGKLMEKTGMGYYVVRRYQNPVTRSLSRLTDRLGGDRNWRVPAVSLSRTTTNLSGDTVDGTAGGPNRPGSRDSSAGNRGANATTSAPVTPVPASPTAPTAATHGLSQSFRERDIRRDVLQSAAAAMASAAGLAAGVVPHSQARAVASMDGAADSGSEPGAHYGQQQRLGGTSPDDGSGEDSTSSLLRMLWEKNLYLGTSQD